MTEQDRQMLLDQAVALHRELARMPINRFNVQKRADRQAELARIEGKLSRESELHAAFIAHRVELVARHHEFAARNGGR
jgi:hypothetical protein